MTRYKIRNGITVLGIGLGILALALMAAGSNGPLAALSGVREGGGLHGFRPALEVQITPLDTELRDGRLLARLQVSANQPLWRAALDLVSADGAEVEGSRVRSLGTISIERAAATEFHLRPRTASRPRLLTFRVRGEGPDGPMARLATVVVSPQRPISGAWIPPAGRALNPEDGRDGLGVSRGSPEQQSGDPRFVNRSASGLAAAIHTLEKGNDDAL